MNRILLWTLVFVFTVHGVMGIGVSPAWESITYQEGGTATVDLTIINNQQQSLQALLVTKGPLQDHIEVQQRGVLIAADEPRRQVSVDVHMPKLEPGTHTGEVVILQVPQDHPVDKADSYVGSVPSVVAEIHVKVPYPDEYVEPDILVRTNGSVADFSIDLKNLGQKDVEEAYALINITGMTLETDHVAIPSGSDTTLRARWEGLQPGVYDTAITVLYDGKQMVKQHRFSVGEPRVFVGGIGIAAFKLGDIGKMEYTLQNGWNTHMENVYLTVEVRKEGRLIDRMKSTSVNLGPQSKGTVEVFWDTQGYVQGEYTLTTITHFPQGEFEEQFEAVLNQDETKVYRTTPSAAVPATDEENITLKALLSAAVVLILINLLWLLKIHRLLRS